MNDPLKTRVDYILANPTMFPQPITVPEIQRHFSEKVSDPTIREAIRSLVMDDGRLICSCDEGFYVPENIEDFRRGVLWLNYRIEPLQERMKQLYRLAKEKWNYAVDGQGELF